MPILCSLQKFLWRKGTPYLFCDDKNLARVAGTGDSIVIGSHKTGKRYTFRYSYVAVTNAFAYIPTPDCAAECPITHVYFGTSAQIGMLQKHIFSE